MHSTQRLLKQHTSDVHARVEASLGLLDGELSVERLRTVLARFAGFWSGTEPAIDAWAGTDPAAADRLSWTRRRRSAILRTDLLRLGLTARELADVPEAQPVFTEPGTADVLGWLYVSEGSTLGGAVIDRALRLRDAMAAAPRTFSPYPEGPGPMWRAYLQCLTEWVGEDPARGAAVLEAACTTFEALERWLVPVAAGLAA